MNTKNNTSLGNFFSTYKKTILLTVFSCLLLGIKAQNVNIPDSVFKAILVADTAINTNGDGEIQLQEAQNYTGAINVNGFNLIEAIADLTGIEAFVNLTSLNCIDNLLTTLDLSNNTALIELNCIENQLTSLDVSNNTALIEFNCSFNQLTTLDLSNNTALIELHCSFNPLTTLDLSNNIALTGLTCRSNQLERLNLANGNNINMDSLSPRIINNPNLFCIQVDDAVFSENNWRQFVDGQVIFSQNCNAIVDITGTVFRDANTNGVQDVGEDGVSGVSVELNGIMRVPTNNDGVYTFGVDTSGIYSISVTSPSNPYCDGLFLPDSVTTNLTIMLNVDTAVSEYRGNDFGLAAPSVPCGMVCGRVWQDDNQDGIQDTLEAGQQGVSIQFSSGELVTTDANGNYCVSLPYNQSITAYLVPALQTYDCTSQLTWQQTFPVAPVDYTINLLPSDSVINNIDFGVFDANSCYDLSVVSIRPYGNEAGENFRAWMDYKAFGNPTDTCYLKLSHDTLISLLNSSRVPAQVETGCIEWAFAPGTLPNFDCMLMTFHLDSTAKLNQELNWEASYFCKDSADCCIENNTLSRTTLVTREKRVNSLANTMEVHHTSGAEEGLIDMADSTFSYVINFQNIGSDRAYHLQIIDTLSSDFRIESISRPFSSLPYSSFTVTKDNVLIMEFDDIFLPGSDNNVLASYGFVQFNLVAQQDLPEGTVLENDARIIFNRGTEYITNTVVNIIDTVVDIDEPTSIQEDVATTNDVRIYPNPTKQWLFVELEEASFQLSVLNLNGQVVKSKATTGRSTYIDMRYLAKGVYALQILQGENKIVKKVIVE